MKIQLISDLHFEFMADRHIYDEINKITAKQKTAEKADILAICGDLCTRKQIVWILNEFAKHYDHVLYVNGNHELYGAHIDQIRAIRTSGKLSENIHWLDNSKVTILGQEFVGCTLWFPELEGNLGYSLRWPDFMSILNFKDYVYKENEISQKFLNDNVSSKSVVLTHYLPTYQSVHRRYLVKPYSNYNRFFVCDMDELIRKKIPQYWLFGHTHEHFDYWFDGIENETRMVSNPKGYLGEEVEVPFEYCKVIKI